MIKLTGNQIEKIKEYVGRVSTIPSVSGVYMYGYHDINESFGYIDLYTVIDCSITYNQRLTQETKIRDIESEKKELFAIPKSSLVSIGIYPRFSNSNAYALSNMNRDDWEVKEEFVGSTILFDRFGDIKRTKDVLSEYVVPASNLLPVVNVGEVLSDGVTKKLIKKANN